MSAHGPRRQNTSCPLSFIALVSSPPLPARSCLLTILTISHNAEITSIGGEDDGGDSVGGGKGGEDDGEVDVPRLCIGDIKLRGLIALGSYGALYEGVCGGTRVAIKQLRSKWLDNAHAQQDFKTEILMLSKFSHPNIVMFMGCVDDLVENVPKLVVLEWVEGGNLYDAIHKERGRPRGLLPAERLHFMGDLAQGMEYLHSKTPCIIHRDIKPHNLLISEPGTRCAAGKDEAGREGSAEDGSAGGNESEGAGVGAAVSPEGWDLADRRFGLVNGKPRRILKIADFGLSRFHTAEAGVATMTGNTGSLRWMAPEVISYKRYNEKVDVYSFAMVVWEMHSYDVPYSSLNVVQVALAVTRGKRLRVPNSCSLEVKSLITQCWSTDHTTRPSFEYIAKECAVIKDSQQGTADAAGVEATAASESPEVEAPAPAAKSKELSSQVMVLARTVSARLSTSLTSTGSTHSPPGSIIRTPSSASSHSNLAMDTRVSSVTGSVSATPGDSFASTESTMDKPTPKSGCGCIVS